MTPFPPEAYAAVSVFVFLAGLCIGSFLNVCIWRIPRDESIAWPGSHCPACNHALAPWDNIPLLSWLILNGKCRHCHAPISPRYFVVELLTGALFAGLWFIHGWSLFTPVYAFFTAALILGTFVDFDHLILPDRVTLGGMVAGLVLSFAFPELQGRGERLADREFNLSTADALPAGNTLKAGAFWDAKAARREFSVETKFAEQLRWQLGDTIAFDVAGQRIEGRITSLRDVRWESFTPNFFVLASPDLARELPATYITAVKVPVGDTRLASALAQAVPNANVIDIDAITGEIRRIGDQAAMVIQVVFWFAFLSGCLVFVAAVAATRRERITELGVLRTLGASSAQLRNAQLVEFGAIGAIAGGIAAVAAAGIGTLFAQRVLDLPPTWSGTTLATGALVGTAAAMLAGWLSMRRHLHATVRETLGAAG